MIMYDYKARYLKSLYKRGLPVRRKLVPTSDTAHIVDQEITEERLTWTKNRCLMCSKEFEQEDTAVTSRGLLCRSCNSTLGMAIERHILSSKMQNANNGDKADG